MGKLKLKGISLMSPTLILWNGSEAVLFEVSEVIHTDTYTHLHKNTHTHTHIITDTKCTHTKVTHTSNTIINNTIQFIATSMDRSFLELELDLRSRSHLKVKNYRLGGVCVLWMLLVRYLEVKKYIILRTST